MARLRVRSLLAVVVFVLSGLSAYAAPSQGPRPPAPDPKQLAAMLAALAARVDKLEGQITSADLVGTYQIFGIQTRLFSNGPGIAAGALTGALILNADGNGSLQINGDGALLQPALQGWGLYAPYTLGNGNPGFVFPLSWAYANGLISLAVDGNPPGPGVPVGPGGRLGAISFSEVNLGEGRADAGLMIFYRLQ